MIMRKFWVIIASTLALCAAPARADVTVCSGAIEPVTVVSCIAAAVVIHELFITDKPFGESGEGMKVLRKPLGGKDGEVQKFIKKPLGGKNGEVQKIKEKPLGGKNSVFRKKWKV